MLYYLVFYIIIMKFNIQIKSTLCRLYLTTISVKVTLLLAQKKLDSLHFYQSRVFYSYSVFRQSQAIPN